MKAKELFDLLKTVSTTVPVAYDHFEQYPDAKIAPPFILYRETSPLTQKADDVTWARMDNFIVDLCVDKKDPTLEESLESLFTTNYLPFDKEEDYLDEERMYQIRYYIS